MIKKRRLGIVLKFSFLTVSLIVLTSMGITAFLIFSEIAESRQEISERARSLGKMLAHNAEFGMYAEDKNYLRNLLESAGAERDVAYAVALSQNMQALSSAGRAGSRSRGGVSHAWPKGSFGWRWPRASGATPRAS